MEFQGTWSFDCCCPRCSDPTEFGTLVSAVICDKCKFGNCLPVSSVSQNSPWKCDYCNATTNSEIVEAKVKRFENEIEDVGSENAEEFLKILRKMRYTLHENHYWILDVKRKLIDIYGNKPGFEYFRLSKVIIVTITKWFSFMHQWKWSRRFRDLLLKLLL